MLSPYRSYYMALNIAWVEVMEQTLKTYILILQIRKLWNISNDSKHGEEAPKSQSHPILLMHSGVKENRLREMVALTTKAYGNSFHRAYVLKIFELEKVTGGFLSHNSSILHLHFGSCFNFPITQETMQLTDVRSQIYFLTQWTSQLLVTRKVHVVNIF